jgi:hypothetical protein
MARTTSSMFVSMAPFDFTWSTSNVDVRAFASSIASRISDTLGGSR